MRKSNLCLIVDCHQGTSQPFERRYSGEPPDRSDGTKAVPMTIQLAGCEQFKLLFSRIGLLIYQHRSPYRERHIERSVGILAKVYF